MRTALSALGVLILSCTTSFAQSARVSQPVDREARQGGESRAVKAARLPKKAHEVRQKGVADGDVKAALRAAKSKGVGAGEMAEVTEEHGRAVDEHGPIDNFGAFVNSKLDEGLRGRELAAAIRAEHAKRGKGKGQGRGNADRTRDDRDRGQRDAERGRGDAERGQRESAERERERAERELERAERDRERAERQAREAKEKADKAEKANKGKGRGKP